jgi:pyruvate kinase
VKNSRYFGRRTKIVGTIGPASGSAPVIKQLIRAGMNVARLNLSHGTYEKHAEYIDNIRNASEHLNIPVALLIDLPGTKYRTGSLSGGSALLRKGAQVVLTTSLVEGNDELVPVNFPSFPQVVKVGETVLLADGAMQLRIQAIDESNVKCKVIVGGLLTPGRGIVVPGMRSSGSFVTEQVREHIDFCIEQKPDYIALSFVSLPEDVEQTRAILHQKGSEIALIAKIERGQAVANFDRLLAVSDAIMVARGDLGVDIPIQRVPLVQKEIIRKSNEAGRPVITATQMLESMVNSAWPTRAEVTDVANAIFDGTDAVMLSGETAVGKYPLLAVRMMDKIARETERQLPYESILQQRTAWLRSETDEVIGYEACHTAHELGAAAIIAFTKSGVTAQRVSRYRPKEPILALTPDARISSRLLLCWGIHPIETTEPSSVNELFALGARLAKELGLAKSGDLIVITGGIPIGVPGTTNLLKVERIK